MKRDIKIIFTSLALFAFAGGLFYNFEELWLLENNLSIASVGSVLSLASVMAISIIYLSANVVQTKKLKSFTIVLLLIKGFMLLSLFLLNGTGYNVLIKLLVMFEWAIDTEIYACMYPLISSINKSDTLYAKSGLIYDGLYYIAVIIIGFLLGKEVLGITIGYNTYVLFASITIFICAFVLSRARVNPENTAVSQSFKQFVSLIKGDTISIYYLLNLLFEKISYYIITGLFLIVLTTNFNFSAALASNIKLAAGIIGVLLGTLILHKLTLKNDYINLSIKYVTRAVLLLLALILNSDILIFIAVLYMVLTYSSFTHIADAPYINRFNDTDQLIFYNIKEMVNYTGRAFGTFLCGIFITISIKCNIAISIFFIIFQILFAFLALNLRLKEKSVIQ